MTRKMAAPTLSNLKKLAARVGATVDADTSGLSWTCYVDLPAGKVIMGSHGTGEFAMAGDKDYQKECIGRLMKWLSAPIENGCETEDPESCDVCNQPEER